MPFPEQFLKTTFLDNHPYKIRKSKLFKYPKKIEGIPFIIQYWAFFSAVMGCGSEQEELGTGKLTL